VSALYKLTSAAQIKNWYAEFLLLYSIHCCSQSRDSQWPADSTALQNVVLQHVPVTPKTLGQYFSVQCSPISEIALLCLTARSLRPLVRMMIAACRWRCVWSVGGTILTEQDAQRTCNLTPPEHCAQRNDSEQDAAAGQAHVVSQHKNLKHVLKCRASFQCEELQEMLCVNGSFWRRPDDDRYESKHVAT